MEGQRRVLGAPVPFEYKGKRFAIRPWTVDQEAEFAAWVLARARRRLAERRRSMRPDDYQAEANALRRDEDAGDYEWNSQIVAAAWSRYRSEGNKYLAWMTLHALDESITPAWVEEFARDKKVYDAFWEEVLHPLNFPNDEEGSESETPTPVPEASSPN